MSKPPFIRFAETGPTTAGRGFRPTLTWDGVPYEKSSPNKKTPSECQPTESVEVIAPCSIRPYIYFNLYPSILVKNRPTSRRMDRN